MWFMSDTFSYWTKWCNSVQFETIQFDMIQCEMMLFDTVAYFKVDIHVTLYINASQSNKCCVAYFQKDIGSGNKYFCTFDLSVQNNVLCLLLYYRSFQLVLPQGPPFSLSSSVRPSVCLCVCMLVAGVFIHAIKNRFFYTDRSVCVF